jgi:hypothetical protein
MTMTTTPGSRPAFATYGLLHPVTAHGLTTLINGNFNRPHSVSNYTPPSEYYQMLIPYFDKCIHVTNDESDNSLIVEVTHYNKKDNRIIRRLQ